MNAHDDDPVIARLKAAADAMTDAPVRWDRVVSLARRRALLVTAALAIVVAAATALLTYGGSVGALKVTGASPVSLPGVTASVPDVRGMRPRVASAELRRAGFTTAIGQACRVARGCTVGDSRPAAGSNAEKGTTVTLVLDPLPLHPAPVAHRPTVHGVGGHVPTRSVPGAPARRPGKPVKIVLSILRPVLEADGRSTTTIQAIVLDARGDRLNGQHVTFTSEPPEQPIAVSSAGAVTIATVTSTTRTGSVVIEARDGGLVASTRFEQTVVKRVKPPCPGSGGSSATAEGTTTGEGAEPRECTPTTTSSSTKTEPTTPTSTTPTGTTGAAVGSETTATGSAAETTSTGHTAGE